MFKAVIESPVSGKGVKGIIFYIPSPVTRFPELTTRKLGEREGGRPPPMMFFDVFEPLFGDAPSPRDRLMGMEHP